MRYRRAYAKDGSYFFTVNFAERQCRFLMDHVAVLRAAVKELERRLPFQIDAFVVLQDHPHAIWTLPERRRGLCNAVDVDQGRVFAAYRQG